MGKELTNNDLDFEHLLKQEITNVICTEKNEPNYELYAKAFYDIYLK